ncbi:membrane protein [Paenibacillus dendritiformis]|uniref:permease n=1 Tax=Paenibacillus dendritiformis TaxID=130049 RepID=UPI0018CCC83E|nr:permease [Paenibacillus dendritiformis]MBG9792571.1 membrane protein [Paenibacillus dendritiformis]
MNVLFRYVTYAVTVVCAAMLYLVFTNQRLADVSVPVDPEFLSGVTTIGISLVIEALPFLMLGVAVSAILHEFVPEGLIARCIPRHPLAGVVAASLIGVLLPLCECGMVPVVRRLIQKGMPVYIGVTYILASPIINPIVFASTSMAFRSQPEMAYSRMGLAFVITVVIGLVLYAAVKKNPLKDAAGDQEHAGGCRHGGHVPHQAAHRLPAKVSLPSKLLASVYHMGDEFLDMGKYLLMGAFITACIQGGIGRDWLAAAAPEGVGSHLFMMGFAYLISLCSTSDAFIAASFSSLLAPGALLTFLVFGPMLDLKTSLMLSGVFRARFVAGLSLLIAVTVLACSLIWQALFL